MSFGKKDALRMLSEAFNEFAAKQAVTIEKGMTAAERVAVELEAMAQSGRQPSVEEVEAVVKSAFASVLTQDDVENVVRDLQELLAGEKTSTAISMLLSSFDVSDIDAQVEGLVGALRDRDQALAIAQGLKQSLNQPGQEDMGAQLSALISQLPVPASIKPLLEMQADRFGSFLDTAKYMSEEEIADSIMAFADEIPTSMVSSALYGLTASMSPEAVSEVLAGLASALPSPQQAGQDYAKFMGIAPKPANNNNTTPKRGGGKNGGFDFGGQKPK